MAKATKSKKPETSTEETTALATNENETEVLDPKVEKEKQKQLKNCEKIIHDKTDSFIEVIVQLAIIKEGNLYKLKVGSDNKPLYKNFEIYIDAEFGFKRAYYSRLNAAYNTYKQIEGKQPEEVKLLPKYPEFYVALSEIKEEKRFEAIEAVKKKAETSKKIRGSDIRKWGTKNKVLVKEKTNNMPSGNKKKVQIFAGLVKDIAKLESIAKELKSLKRYDENTQQTLINNLQKILKNLK